MIRALVFDFDGLILDTESALIAAYADVYAAHGVPFEREPFLRSVGHSDFTFNPWAAFGPAADRDALETVRRGHNHRRDLELPVLPGVVALLDAARQHGLRVALASNSSHGHCERHLARLGLLERFDTMACREDVTRPKPAPDLYRLVLSRLGLGDFQAIAFEDSHSGSLAAKRANLWCVAAPGPTTRHHDFSHADRRVASLTECSLPGLLADFGS